MQSIYAFRQAERSDYQLALDLIHETFAPDLNSPTPQDLKKLEGYRKLGSILFEESVQKGQISAEEEMPKPVHEAVTKAIGFYQNQTRKDQAFLGKQMISEAEKIYDRYIWLLLLLIELADYVQREEEERQHRQIRPQPSSRKELKFHYNQVIKLLKEHQPLEKEAIRRGLNWGAERAFVKELYKEVIKKDPAYTEYTQLADASFEEDKKIVNHIAKNIIFKHELSNNFFQMLDLSWPENKDVLKSMVTKTIKNIEESKPDSLELLDLAINWEDDRDFFADLYKYTIENDEQYEEMVSGKTKNWDVERVAALDKILLKMAIAEIMHFPSIPVKVTINEYIELSKVYSTPKSKQFVNGMLDAISAELTAKGLVKKSGRGLIDNK
ncbi:transcription antitermination factor NusB [Rhodocytophaga rosea]|nr:transcription antitermination factor NusB [Rhodocytophaga rosea]